MSNKKVILGVAAGVAALTVVGIIAKRKGYLNNWSERAGELGHNLKDKFSNVKESAKQKFDEIAHKGGDIAGNSSSASAAGKTATKSTGRTGNINPATT